MTIHSWIRNRFARPVTRPPRQAPARWRPTLEALEDRTVPSTFTVMNTSDSGAGSLRQAILDANAALGADVITFDPTAFSTPQTIRLLSSLPDISDDLAINGPAATRLTISGDANNDGVNDDGDVRILSISAGNVTLSCLTLTNGRARGADGSGGHSGGRGGDAAGGAVYVGGGAVTLNNSSLSNNTAQGGRGGNGLHGGPGGDGHGGAIYVNGGASATLVNSTLSANSAQGGAGGSGNGLFGIGQGGGLYNFGSLTLTNITVSGNSASTDGGGLWNGGAARLTNVTVSGNSASTGRGGGLSSEGTATLTNVTVNNNTSVNGGGVSSGGTAILTNVTVSGNFASLDGGGLAIGGTATLTNVTVSGNSAGQDGGGLFIGVATATLTNTIVAGNTGVNIRSFGNVSATHSLVDVDPMLAPLGDYGGPTQTMALLPGSPAIDAGDSTAAGLPGSDQRGFARISGAAVDIGAYEVQAISLSPATLPDGAYGAAYNQALTANEAGYQGTFSFAVTTGALPAGLSLASDGTLSGTPTAAGASSFTVTATDSAGFTANQSYTLTIDKVDLYVTATANSKTYGQTASDTGTLSGVVNGDGITASFASAGDAANAPVGTGSYAITATLADPNNQLAKPGRDHGNDRRHRLLAQQERPGADRQFQRRPVLNGAGQLAGPDLP
jgi:hypothetical protein